jgi:hypothetical protein
MPSTDILHTCCAHSDRLGSGVFRSSVLWYATGLVLYCYPATHHAEFLAFRPPQGTFFVLGKSYLGQEDIRFLYSYRSSLAVPTCGTPPKFDRESLYTHLGDIVHTLPDLFGASYAQPMSFFRNTLCLLRRTCT